MSSKLIILAVFAILLINGIALAQTKSMNFDKVWLQGESDSYTTTFNGSTPPYNQITSVGNLLFFAGGNSGICDSNGDILIVSDGLNVYDRNLHVIDGGGLMAPQRITSLNQGWSPYTQSSIILPFDNGKYRLITPSVSDDSCIHNWEQVHNGAVFDLLLYDEIDMNANGGAGKVVKRMVPLLQNVRLSKTQMMACRHGDGKAWWLLKQASDTNVIYKFLFTDDRIYGPYIQGFGSNAANFGYQDLDGQAMFSKDGTKYATCIQGYGKVFVADFDRCSGMLSDPHVYKIPAQLTGNPVDLTEKDSSTCGLSFSPNGRFLYIAGIYNVQQLDLHTSAWTRLSGPDTSWQEFQEYSNIYPGPDGRLYIGNWGGGSGQMSVINTPDATGTAASFCRKCLRFPGYMDQGITRFAGVATPPCMPNYALGPTNPICYPAGVSSSVVTVDFRLYPNPVQSTVTIEYSQAGVLKLYDITGRFMESFALRAGGKTASLNVGHIPPGIYQYIYATDGIQQKAGKLVIAR